MSGAIFAQLQPWPQFLTGQEDKLAGRTVNNLQHFPVRALLQRVSTASVEIDARKVAAISQGILVLLGIESADNEGDIEWLCQKISRMRIFPDSDGKMNLSLLDISGQVLVVSQFTLHASTKKGNRPSFLNAAQPSVAEPLYESFCAAMESQLSRPVPRGIFGADMKVSLINDGPVTIWLDSRNRE